ncbi:MAG TPA: DUF1826 domain-containing protein [Paenirhodobacter sp.]
MLHDTTPENQPPQNRTSYDIAVARTVLRSPNGLILRDIARPGVAGAIWQRPRDEGFADWIDTLPEDCLPVLRTSVAVGGVEAAIQSACDLSGMPAGGMRNRLAGDAAALAFLFAGIVECARLNLRLEPVRPQDRAPFRIDRLRARLLCSYRGPGAELAPASDDDDMEPTVRLDPGTAILMRGALWPGHEVTGLVHRPALVDQVGLMLSLDPAGVGERVGVN